MKRTAIAALVPLAMLSWPTNSRAQDIPPEARARGRRLQEEAMAHVEAQRWALAAEGFREMYELGREHGLARAPIALWDMGLALMRIPGRERVARDAFRRFLDESTTLTEDAQVRDWRSTALEHIAELDARIGDGDGAEADAAERSGSQAIPSEVSEGTGDATAARSGDTSASGGLSPVGPVVLGFGGVALVAGGILGGVVLAQDQELAAMCPGGRCPESARSRADEIERLSLSTDVLLIGGRRSPP